MNEKTNGAMYLTLNCHQKVSINSSVIKKRGPGFASLGNAIKSWQKGRQGSVPFDSLSASVHIGGHPGLDIVGGTDVVEALLHSCFADGVKRSAVVERGYR